jgi:hypothetical protein
MKSRWFYIKDNTKLVWKNNDADFGELISLEDGYVHWFLPECRSGAVPGYALEDLGMLIKSLNESWDTRIMNDRVFKNEERANRDV